MNGTRESKIDRHPRLRPVLCLLTIFFSLRVVQVVSILNDRLTRQMSASFSGAFATDLATTIAEVIAIGLLVRFFLGRPERAAKAALARSERRYRCLAEDSADMIFVVDRGAFDPASVSAMAASLGCSLGDIRLYSLRRFICREDRRLVRDALASLSDSEPRRVVVLRLRRSDGDIVFVDATFRRVDHCNESDETLVMIRDVTARHRESEESRRAMLIAQRAKAEADEANKAKTEFLACMSHEIRTPLHSVIGFASLLLNQRHLSPDVRLYGERIRSSGGALLTLVNDILDISRVEAGGIELKPGPFSLFHIVDECLSIVRKEATAKSLSLHLKVSNSLPKRVIGDEARLRQVLLNLLYNAIKFTSDGSVCLQIHQRAEGSEVRFGIVDTGIGIDAKDQARLFERFTQLDGSMRRSHGGAGLGLAISKRLVELMGGTIGVESEKGVGSTFWIAIPLPVSHAISSHQPLVTSHATPARRILVVEDVQLNQELIQTMLRADNHWVDVVGNGAEAVMAVRDCTYDLVLMDIQMPFMDGLSATRMIRSLEEACRDVPIVAMTANGLPEQREMARDAGMNDVILKPFTLAELDVLLKRLGRDIAPRSPLSGPLTFSKLQRLIGEVKLKGLLANLADSVEQRFLGDHAGHDQQAIRRHAHASVAGCGMLGFTEFANRCRVLEHCSEDEFLAVFAVLRREAVELCAYARALTLSSVDGQSLSSAA